MLHDRWNRRNFLKASLAGMFVLLGSTPAFPKIAETDLVPEGHLSLFNTHNKERLTVAYRTVKGEYDPEAIAAINRILRCHYTNEVKEMDVRVIEYLNEVDKKLGSGGHEIHIISGYRSPAYNSLLRREGRHVAGHSLHMKGQAIDIAIPNLGIDRIRRTALNLHAGGVGYYPGAGFVHIDSGSFRTWG